jgi:hypothetical protein
MKPVAPGAERVQDPEAVLAVLIQTRILPVIEVTDAHLLGTSKALPYLLNPKPIIMSSAFPAGKGGDTEDAEAKAVIVPAPPKVGKAIS